MKTSVTAAIRGLECYELDCSKVARKRTMKNALLGEPRTVVVW